MRFSQRLYYSGMALVLVLIVAGELIWLPDPLRFGTGLYWIDALDLSVYVVALIPLIWMLASLLILLNTVRKPSASRAGWAFLRSAAVFAAGVIALFYILTQPKQLEYWMSALGAAWLLVFVDLLFMERKNRRIPMRSLSTFVVMIGLLFFLCCPTGYMVTYPGLTVNMNRYAQAAGASSHGSMTGVLVFERPAFPIDWVYAKLLPHYGIEVNKLQISLGEYNKQVRIMKVDANAAGSAIAFQKLGLGKGITSNGVIIMAITKNSPVEGILQLGDVIEAVNKHKVSSAQELAEYMVSVKPGDQVEVQVLRGDKSWIVQTKTQANPSDPNRAAFGVNVSNKLQYDIPATINYRSFLLHEGGPSHGALLALTLIDQLTPCGITYGNKVAGTGTIEPDGSVGSVGGLEQKAYTVSRTDSDVFFVPYTNEQDARKGAPGLQIVPVHTLDDMLNWLKLHPKQEASSSCLKGA
ncbi:PDZ domain-containing protein [Paenibacillus sp. LMG 31456]|uniref:PDZ domain-containing protein n=1 Tax=Paenibacillus foliorum TaxID=2654974 RepID=A0A972GPV9_9BACL|nr:PDZ domain-containing protein [Paenibacillus foliorum]NOU93950.1 PDZ domain-containing protein [Paenibacillus foliorum]